METAVATPARSTAAVPFALLDVEDLHDADLDGVLADGLLDAEVADASARILADAVGRPGAMSAHALDARALLLAVF